METRKYGSNNLLSELVVDNRGVIAGETTPDITITTYTKYLFTYYPRGEINIITTIEFDNTDTELWRRDLKHFLDGRQPKIMLDTRK